MAFPGCNPTGPAQRPSDAMLVAILVIASLLPLGAAATIDHRLLGDDALITLTYAKNLARGDGFVFNHAPATLGTTSPLFAALVALASLLLPWIELTALAVWIGAACWAGLPWLFFLFRRELAIENRTVAVVGSVVAASVWVQYLGMEAPLFAFLLVLAVCLFLRRRAALAGCAVGLLFLTRGEGALLFGILLAWAVLEAWRGRADRRSPLLGLVAGFAVPLGAWAAWATVRFGGIFPNTLSAKLAQGHSGLWRSFGGSLLFEWAPGWGATLGPCPFINPWYALALAGGVAVLRRRRCWLALPAWMLVYVAAYTALGVPSYPWYAVPVHFVLTLLVALGLDALLARLEALGGKAALPELAVGLTCVLCAAIALPGASELVAGRGSDKDRAYLELGRWFHDHTEPRASVAYHEIGYLGYYSDNRVVDLLGLIDPEIAPNVAALDFSSAFWSRRPDYFVHLAGSRFLAGIVRHPEFGLAYRQVAHLPGYDGQGLTIYRRQDAPLASK